MKSVIKSRRGDLITVVQTHSTQKWFHFPVGTPIERVVMRTKPMMTEGQLQRLSLLRRQAE